MGEKTQGVELAVGWGGGVRHRASTDDAQRMKKSGSMSVDAMEWSIFGGVSEKPMRRQSTKKGSLNCCSVEKALNAELWSNTTETYEYYK